MLVKGNPYHMYLEIRKTRNTQIMLGKCQDFPKRLLYFQGSKLSVFFFFQGAQLHIQKLDKGVSDKNQYIFGLPTTF